MRHSQHRHRPAASTQRISALRRARGSVAPESRSLVAAQPRPVGKALAAVEDDAVPCNRDGAVAHGLDHHAVIRSLQRVDPFALRCIDDDAIRFSSRAGARLIG